MGDMVRGLLRLSQDMVMAMLPATPTEAHRDSVDTMVVMDMVMVMARGLPMLSQDMAMAMDMELLLSMCPRLTMDMVITHNLTPTDIALDTDMVRGLLKLSQDMVMAMLSATPTEAHRDSMDTMVVMDMVMVMVRGLLMLDMVMAMLPATPTEAHRDSMDTMVVMDMVMVMVRGRL